MTKISQLNMNHARRAQDLKKVGKSEGWVLIRWKEWRIMSIYLTPKTTREEFEERLEDMEKEIRKGGKGKIIVAGDFNAKARLWSSVKECSKGRTLCEWAAALNMKVMNQGTECTFRRGKGESIVDITMGRGGAENEIKKWKVLESETLSDHELIQFEVGRGIKTKNQEGRGRGNRWAVKKLNKEELLEIVAGNTWITKGENGEKDKRENTDTDKEAERLREILIKACDAAMPRVRNNRRRGVAWWSERLNELRKRVNDQRRWIKRNNRKRKEDRTRREVGERETKILSYKLTKELYAREIGRAKVRGWKELIETLNQDPWGRPYRIVRQKMKSNGEGPITESADPEMINEIVDNLFPGTRKATKKGKRGKKKRRKRKHRTK